jgi:peptidoglycan/xylan/chitin deacetylase (PgdA/CDA1 family)
VKVPVSWPEGVQSALCLTFDIDGETMWTSVDPDNARRPFVVGQAEYEFNVGIPLFLELLERHGIRTTFFVCGGVALEHPDSIRSIHAAGHEIACHGWLHESTDGFSRADEYELIERSTNALVEVVGERPVGYRAGLADVNPQTWGILRELGYIYSSNLQTSLWPYLHAGDGPGLVEIPLHASLDDGPYYLTQRRPPNYRQYYSPHTVYEIFSAEFEGIHELGGVTDLVLHPQLSGRPSRLNIIEDLIEVARSTPGVWFPTMREIAQHCLSGGLAARDAA